MNRNSIQMSRNAYGYSLRGDKRWCSVCAIVYTSGWPMWTPTVTTSMWLLSRKHITHGLVAFM